MALVKDPVGRARAAKTKTQAARLMLDLEAELALNDDLPAGWEAQADEAIRILERAHQGEDLRDPSATDGPQGRGYAPKLSRKAGTGLAGGKRPAGPGDASRAPRAGGDASRRAGASRGNASQSAMPSRRPRRSSPPGRAGRRGGGRIGRSRVLEQTGLPSAGRSASAFGLQVLGLMIGLSLLYLVLTNAQTAGRGRSAVEQLFGSVSMGVRLLIAPVDPLSSRVNNATERAIATGEQAGPPAPVIPLAPRRQAKTAGAAGLTATSP